MKILLTGASGFIGRALLKNLSAQELFSIYHSFKFSCPDQNRFFLDLGLRLHVDQLLHKLKGNIPEVIIHLASVDHFKDNPDYGDDLKMAAEICRLCNRLGVSKLILASGWVVYDPQSQIPFTESTLLKPKTAYGQSKLRVENFLKKNLANKTSLVNLRISSVYGPSQTSTGLIPNLVKGAIQKKEMAIESIETRRDYLYIDDLINLLERLIRQPLEDNVDLNAGSGQSVRVLDVALEIQGIFFKNYHQVIPLIIKPPLDVGDPPDNLLDIKKCRELFGFRPQTNLPMGLKNYVEWTKKKNIF